MKTENLNNKIVNSKEKPKDKKAVVFLIIKWTIIVIIVFVVFFLLTKPLRGYSSNNYVTSGDNYLKERKFLAADLEYQKALVFDPGNIKAEGRRILEKASKNVLELENFPNINFSAKIKEATVFPENEVEAVKLSKKLIEENEYQLATIPALTATEMDKEYRDAWLYYGIANLKSGELLQIKPEIKEEYFKKAKEAFAKVKEIDPEYKIPAGV